MLTLKLLMLFLMLNCICAQDKSLAINKSQYQFSDKLANKIAIEKNKNIVYSPYSIATALTMCFTGATDNTAKQLRRLLHFDNLPLGLINQQNLKLIMYLNQLNSKNLTLNIANKLYLKSGFHISPEFVFNLNRYYRSQIELINFNQPQLATSRINSWVSEKTNGKIRDLINPNAINAATRLVLINAIYFKGNWLIAFDKANTKKQTFFLEDGSTKQVDMMHIPRGKFRLRLSPFGMKVDICEFPYAGNTMTMAIVLPHKGVAMSEFEKTLDLSKIMAIVGVEKEVQLVDVYVPKFKYDQQFELKNVLSSMNAPDAFNPKNASFKGISTHERLYISNVVHKAVIEVSEEGTEAAAATAVIVARTMAAFVGPMIPVFRCDRPFLFFIYDNRYKTVLFGGKYVGQ